MATSNSNNQQSLPAVSSSFSIETTKPNSSVEPTPQILRPPSPSIVTNFDRKNYQAPKLCTQVRCTVPNCNCENFVPGKLRLRYCETCNHGWVPHGIREIENITPFFHFLAYTLDPTLNKEEYPLLIEEKSDALDIVSQYFADAGLLPLLIKLEARSDPFHKTMFSNEIIKNITAVQWWRSQKDFPEIMQVLIIVISVLCASAFSADVDRMCSSYGLVHPDIRNILN